MEVSALKPKLFLLNASSFALDKSVEEFLRSKGAISLDFGFNAYINSELVSVILSQLLEESKSAHVVSSKDEEINHLKEDVINLLAEIEKRTEENARLTHDVRSCNTKLISLNEQALDNSKLVERLKAENAQPNAKLKSTVIPKVDGEAHHVDNSNQYCEKLQKELQKLRSQNVEAIASLKVLEEENEELQKELERLKNPTNSIISKAG